MRRLGPLTVICVDDEPDILRLLKVAAEFQPDFEVVATTGDASAAIDLIHELHPDVLILDHRLIDLTTPGRETVDVVSTAIVAEARTCVPDATVAVFTGRESISAAGLDVGDVWVRKPHLDELWSAIRDARERDQAG
jgi:DNA-binding NarL/FixJ family response regulator